MTFRRGHSFFVFYYFLIPHNFSSFQANTSQKFAITFSEISTNHEIHYLRYSSSTVEDNIILKVCHVYKLIGALYLLTIHVFL